MREVARDYADATGGKGVVVDTCYKLFIDKKVQCAAPSYDGEGICLAEGRVNGGTCILSQCRVEFIVFGEKKSVIAIVTDAKVVKVGVCVIRAKNESAFVSSNNGHLCLEGKVAKVGRLREANYKVVL